MHDISLDTYLGDLEELWVAICTDDNGLDIGYKTQLLKSIVDLMNEIKEIMCVIEQEDENEEL